MISPRARADLILVLITAFWGVTFVVVKDALGHADPLSFLTLRFGVGALAATILARGRLFHGPTLRAGALLAVFLYAGFILQTWGLLFTTPSRSAFITGMSVLLVPILSIALFRRVPALPSWLGVAFAVLGLFLLTGGRSVLTATTSTGDALTLGCAIAYGFHITLTEKFARTGSVTSLVAVQLWIVTGLSALSMPFSSTHVEWTASFIAAFIFCGVFASAVAISVQTWGQARTTAVRAALIFSLEPVFAALFSVAMRRESLGVPELLGGGLIILGVVVAEVGSVWWRRRALKEAA